MKRRLQTTSSAVQILLVMMLFSTMSWAQSALPFVITNKSPEYTDDQLYVAIVGQNASNQHVWINCQNSAVNFMDPSYNTVAGPVYSGNKGPGNNAMYANCFTKLSAIPNKTVSLPTIQGCRMFIATKQQLYFYFFGASGGYTSPSSTDPSDPNTGIKYEIIELTYNQYGFWGNTTRVDGYQYPMGLELYGSDVAYQQTGEKQTHAQIGSAFMASVPDAFKVCYNSKDGSILFPTKTVAWADGSIGTMPNVGPYVNYMQPYIDQVWNKYKNEDLSFVAGDAGIWTGRVDGSDKLTMTCTSGGFNGRKAVVTRRPTTQEALEGKGVFNQVNQDATTDLVVQAQLCAALTRHIISTGTPQNPQIWSDRNTYYPADPCNEYSKFWHRTDISVGGFSYGFAYDDVFSQSSTLHASTPTKVVVTFGGFAGTSTTNIPPTVSLTAPVNNATYTAAATISITANAADADGSVSKVDFYNGSTLLGTDASSPYAYTWTGVGAGTYSITAKATDNAGAVTTSGAVSVTVKTVLTGVTGLNNNYYLQNRYSGLYMDVAGANAADGTNIQQWTYNGSAAQQYTFTDLGSGTYQILNTGTGKSVDVAGVSVDNGANVQEWTYNGGSNQKFVVTSTGDGYYKLVSLNSGKLVEVAGFSTAAGGNVQQWEDAGQLSAQWKFIPVVSVTNGTGDGLTGNYFNGMNFETPVYNRKDATINFDWGTGSPNAAVNADGFSARWSGQIQPRYSDVYTFYANTDNGRRVWINGQLVIDKWIDDWGIEYTGTITLTANQKYDIKVEYFEDYGGANAKLEWSSASQTREVIPTSQLYSNPLPTVNIASPANNAAFNAPASITITSSASDNVSVAKVEYYNGSTKLGEVSGSPYSFTWSNVAVGTYTLTARATDNQGGITVSGGVTVKVNTATTTPNQAPSVSLTTPANGSSSNAPASVTISANASDADGTVSKVDFYNGTTLLFSDATSPYSYAWTGVGAGTYTISAKATDNAGAVTTSGSVSITIKAVAVDACSGLATYSENNGYVAGSKVKNAGRQYECKEFPYSGWCNGAAWAYGPGTGAYWSDAWYDRGTCSARTGNDATDASTDAEVTVSPNPASGFITINTSATVKVSIYSSQGLEMMTSETVAPQGTVNISGLAAGMYLVKIDTGTEVVTKMIVKN